MRVSEDGLAYGGEIIPLDAQNVPRLAEAIDALRRDCIGETNPSDPVELAFAKAGKAAKSAVAEFARLEAMDLDGENRLKLAIALESWRNELERIYRATGV